MRRSWGLRTRVLVAAGLTAAVAIVTFGILLKGLQDQRRAATQGRGTSEALVASSDLLRVAQDIERGHGAGTGPQLRAAQRRLAGAEQDERQADDVARINSALTAYASRPDEAGFDEVRRVLDRYVTAEQAELVERRARSTSLRDRSIFIATAGLVVLLALIAALAAGAVRAIVAPVGRLQRFARELGAGRLETRLPEGGPPETAELALVFNLTAAQLEQAQAELRRLSERHLAPERTLTTADVAELLARVRAGTAGGTAEACLRLALYGGGAAARDDIAVLVAQVPPRVRSTAGRSERRESSTRGQ